MRPKGQTVASPSQEDVGPPGCMATLALHGCAPQSLGDSGTSAAAGHPGIPCRTAPLLPRPPVLGSTAETNPQFPDEIRPVTL